ncbi:MAG: serine/threonine protein phosphatase [Atopobiaceae bacterium]|nr:serine/threonine protein phosphatase [Atopobiaceae bacterium]
MAIYVFSDVHGQLNALETMLDHLSPSSEDVLYMLGDMVDRGPDPVGVMKLCRDYPNMHVLMGNHEKMMLDCLRIDHSLYACYDWEHNGCDTTRVGLDALERSEYNELLDWVEQLPLYKLCTVGDQSYVLVHAGIMPPVAYTLKKLFGTDEIDGTFWTEEHLTTLLENQDREDLLWIREDFWGKPTGLVDKNGVGPVVIAGHSPTVLVERYVNASNRGALDDEGRMRMLRVGACELTGGVADRLAIDCGAGTSQNWGQLMVLRLDDMREFYLPIMKEG